MGLEGIVSKSFFAAYFQNNNWTVRRPRIKSDALNATLDIGYTILFNYIESFVRISLLLSAHSFARPPA